MKKNSSYWYCPKCKEELDGCHVTYQELCEYCGTAVLSVPESISQETIEEIIKAKAEGRLVVLPCKIGDTVYVIIDSVDIPYVRQEKVIAIELWNKNGAMTMFIRTPYGLFEFDKTVFLTHEEAEKVIGGKRRMSELKKCPFCGNEADISNGWYSGEKWLVRCISGRVDNDLPECPAAGGAIYKTKEEAIKAWNTRESEGEEG